jgi:hypothetical protein
MDVREALEAIARRISEVLTIEVGPDLPDFGHLAPEVDDQLATHRSGLFLGLWDEPALAAALEQEGVLAALRARVGAEVSVRVLAAEGLLRIYRADRPETPDSLLVELKAHIECAPPERLRALGFPAGTLLAIDSMLMQDPGRPFPPGRRPLPGQRYPGLGIGLQVLEAIRRGAQRLRATAVIGIPAYYHAAVLYHRLFAFADPVAEGRFQALRRDLRGLALAEATTAIEEGRVRDGTSAAPYRWEGVEMVLPIGARARAYLRDPRYGDAAARTLAGTRFVLAPGIG